MAYFLNFGFVNSMELELCSQTGLLGCTKPCCLSVRPRWKRGSRNILALSSAAAGLFLASGFVAADSVSAACAENDGHQTDGTADCPTSEHETPFGDSDTGEVTESADDATSNPETREHPCCAGVGLTDQQIRDMPEAEWTELVERSEAERRNQEQMTRDQEAYDDWESVYDEANSLVQQSAQALEMNDLVQAEELHRQASEVWSRAPELSYLFGSSRGRELYGVENSLVAVDEALNDGGRPVIGGARSKLNLPELPSRVIDPPSESENVPGQEIAVDDLDVGSLSWALDDVLDGDPQATRTVKVTLTQANSGNVVTAAVEVALVDGQISEVTVEGVPIQSVRDRVERDLRRIRPPQSTDGSRLEDPEPKESQSEPKRFGLEGTGSASSSPPVDLDFTSSIDANIWGLHTADGTYVGEWGSNTGTDIWSIEDWLSETSSGGFGFSGRWSFNGQSETAPSPDVKNPDEATEPVGESKTDPPATEIPTPATPADFSWSDRDGDAHRDGDNQQFSLGNTSTFGNYGSDFSFSEILGEGFSTSDSPGTDESQSGFGHGLANDDFSFERFSFNSDSTDDGVVDNSSDGSSSDSSFDDGPQDASSSFSDGLGESSLDSSFGDDSATIDSDQSRSDSDSGNGFSGFGDLSFESSLDSDSLSADDSGLGGFSFDSSIDRSFSAEPVDIDLGTQATGFGDLSIDNSSSISDPGFGGLSPTGSFGQEPLDISVDEPSASTSDSGSSEGFSFTFGGISFDW